MTLPAARRLRSALAVCAAALAIGLAVPCPAAAQEGAAAVQDVTLTEVVIPLGATLVKVPKLTASGTRLSRDDLAAIFKADSSEPWPARLARLDAASLTAPVLVSDQAGPGDLRQTTTYRDVIARDVRAGKIGELTAAGVTISAKGDKPMQNGAGTYGSVRATDLDLTALARLAVESGDGKGPDLRVYGTLRVSDMAFSNAQAVTFKIARFDGRDLSGRQVPNGWNHAFDALSGGFADPAGKRAANSATADLLAAQTIGSAEVRGISISDSSADAPWLTEVERISYAASGPDAGVVVEGLTLANGPVRSRLGRLTLAGASLGPLIAEFRRMADRPDEPPGPVESRALAAGLGTLTLTDLTVDLPPTPPVQKRGALDTPRQKQAQAPKPTVRTRLAEARPPDARPGEVSVMPTVKPERIALRQGVFGFGPVAQGAPPSTRLALTGLDVPAALAAGLPLVGALPAFGYGDLSFDLTAEAAWDEAARTVALRDMTVSGKDIGTVKLAALFGGIGPELFSGSVPAETMLMFAGSARTLDVTIENGGLFERFLTAQAKELSLKPDELRKEYVTASVLGVPVILGNGPAAKDIGAAMGQFVMNPGKLTIRAKAKEPAGIGFVEIGTARSPGAVLDRIDVDAKAN
ncbi:hypothetical protein [Methylobacterium sp. J-076]|uniref:hypothetical protein n=1 Tax=Methylobacterium sp. J-076 TaxID=2836655 RepID=UPI001FB912ED|nr:hypothetical protein [Methylobacterium sp. J-076]MCJ2013090.1 hypothetical protein [Methylobacterium sp. J-076]